MPSLRMALTLEIILGIPIHILFPEQFEQAYKKIVKRINKQKAIGKAFKRDCRKSKPQPILAYILMLRITGERGQRNGGNGSSLLLILLANSTLTCHLLHYPNK